MSLSDIDFAERYRQHMQRIARPQKTRQDWDRRAAEMNHQSRGGGYVSALLDQLDLRGIDSVLDVGCGPGSLSVALARQVRQVYAMDFSPAMLDCLRENAAARQLHNIQPILRAWEDDWQDIPPADLLLASRSTTVADLRVVLARLASHARVRVCLTQPVAGCFTDPQISAVLGVQVEHVPDYIYTLNLLHQQGIYPRLDYIDTPSRLAGCSDFNAFADKVAWSFGSLSTAQRAALQDWYEADPQRAARGGRAMRWAVIQWTVTDDYS